MLKIFIVSCNITDLPYPVYPLGMAMLSDFLRSKGHDVAEGDLLSESNDISVLTGKIKSFSPDVIGLSLRNVDNINFTEQETYYRHYRNIVSELKKKFSSVPIVLGGSGFSLFPDELIELTGADYGIAGEGENAFEDLLGKLERGELPEEKIFRSSKRLSDFKSNGGSRAFAAFYLREGGMLNIQSKRGCSGRCVYCNYPVLEGSAFRFRDASDVAEEIEKMIKDCNADYLFFTDSIFNDPGGKYLELAEEMIRRSINIRWMAFFKPARFNDSEVDLLRRSGLSAVEWGTDSASDKVLAELKKGFRWASARMSTEMFSKAGIACSHFIIFGAPGETEDTINEGLENISGLQRAVVFGTLGIRIYPGTELYERALREKLIDENTNLLEPVFYFSPDAGIDFMKEKISNSWAGRQDRIFTWDRKNIDIARSCHRMGFRGPAWDLILK